MSTDLATKTVARSDLSDALEASGLNKFEIYESYSGRRMGGESCFGIVVEPSDERRVFVALGWACGFAEASDGDFYEAAMAVWEQLIRRASVDSMGRQTIVHFPGWTLA